MKIKIFTVGGTIDKVYFDKKSKYEVGDPIISDILKNSNVTLKYKIQSILHKDSLDMTKTDRKLIAKTISREKSLNIVVTHGTDTMIKTAKFVKRSLKDNEKTIVFTGSMTPAIFKNSDAVFNIGGAIIASQSLPPGVYIIMNGKIFDPEKSVKNVSKNCFEKKDQKSRSGKNKDNTKQD